MAGGEIREVESPGAAQGGSAAWAPGAARGHGAGDTRPREWDNSRTQLFPPMFVPELILGVGECPWPLESMNLPAFPVSSLAVGPFDTGQVWKKWHPLPRQVLLVPV